jgi:hypothetical protein
MTLCGNSTLLRSGRIGNCAGSTSSVVALIRKRWCGELTSCAEAGVSRPHPRLTSPSSPRPGTRLTTPSTRASGSNPPARPLQARIAVAHECMRVPTPHLHLPAEQTRRRDGHGGEHRAVARRHARPHARGCSGGTPGGCRSDGARLRAWPAAAGRTLRLPNDDDRVRGVERGWCHWVRAAAGGGFKRRDSWRWRWRVGRSGFDRRCKSWSSG